MQYEKVIVRNKTYRKGQLNSKLVMLTADHTFSSVDDFIKHYSLRSIMEDLFNEEIQGDDLKSTFLYKQYMQVINTGNENDSFLIMYKVKDDLAVKITEHIYLHHICNGLGIAGEEILPWVCIDSKLYIADTWWESDDNVLEDMSKLSYINFLSKYKGY